MLAPESIGYHQKRGTVLVNLRLGIVGFRDETTYKMRTTMKMSENQISYQRKDDYYLLFDQYINELITPEVFQSKLLKMEKQDGNRAKIILTDFQQLETFLVELLAIEFSFLLGKVSDLAIVAREFGPKNGISNEHFRESIEKIYSEMADFFDK